MAAVRHLEFVVRVGTTYEGHLVVFRSLLRAVVQPTLDPITETASEI